MSCNVCNGIGKIKEATNPVISYVKCNGEKSFHDSSRLVNCDECNSKGNTDFEESYCPFCNEEGGAE